MGVVGDQATEKSKNWESNVTRSGGAAVGNGDNCGRIRENAVGSRDLDRDRVVTLPSREERLPGGRTALHKEKSFKGQGRDSP